MAKNERNCIFILGGRSGTSALAGTFNILGLEIGKELLLPAGNNPKGFYENNKILTVNDSILAALDSDVEDVRSLPENWWQDGSMKAFRNEIIKIVEDDFAGLDIFLVKCPRICILLPLWLDVMKELYISPKFIFSLRHPLSIVRSTMISQKLTFDRSLLIWFKFILNAEYFSRANPRVFVRYDDLIEDPEAVIDKICSVLEFKPPRDFYEARKEIEDFLDPSLRHHVYNRNIPHDGESASLANALYQVFDPCGDIESREEPDYDRIAEIRSKFNAIRNRTWFEKLLMKAKLR